MSESPFVQTLAETQRVIAEFITRYNAEWLMQVRMRVGRRKHIALHRGPAPVPAGPTERWSMDFVHDALAEPPRSPLTSER